MGPGHRRISMTYDTKSSFCFRKFLYSVIFVDLFSKAEATIHLRTTDIAQNTQSLIQKRLRILQDTFSNINTLKCSHCISEFREKLIRIMDYFLLEPNKIGC